MLAKKEVISDFVLLLGYFGFEFRRGSDKGNHDSYETLV